MISSQEWQVEIKGEKGANQKRDLYCTHAEMLSKWKKPEGIRTLRYDVLFYIADEKRLQ